MVEKGERTWRLGILVNGKPNAAELLRAFGYRLADRISLTKVTNFEKPDFGEPADETIVKSVKDVCDIVLVGVGD